MRQFFPKAFLAAVACGFSVFAWLPAAAQAQAIRAEELAAGLENPWAVAFLPQGRFLVTERVGRLRVVEAGRLGAPLAGLPDIAAGGQGGLLDLVLDSDFAQNRTLYFCFSEPGAGGNSTALARARLSADMSRLEEVKVIFSQQPKVASRLHFGCRIVEARDGLLFLTLGERFQRKDDAQSLDNHHGKVVRLTKEGAAAPGNPFAGRAGALPEIWSYGHRNPQGATLGPDGRLWINEHGPQGGDEINLPQPGRNYGWPVITYGENYGGGKIGEGITARTGMEQPLHHWVPSIAPSGMAFLTSDRYGPAMKGNLFIGSLKFGYLARLELADGKVAREHKLLEGVGRVRDVRQGPDGLLYVLTDESKGRLLRLLPQ
jgi:aldose sugar dehydrogenase